MKRALIISYILVVAVMATATFVEKLNGFRVYDQWWFTALWAVLAAVAIVWFLKRRVRRLSVVTLHLGFVVILLGALLTHLFARQGIVHLRQGVPTAEYTTEDGRLHALPFRLTLDSFQVEWHAGTRAAADYVSHLSISKLENTGKESVHGTAGHNAVTVSMNNIHTEAGVRLCQMSYDDDQHGTVLSVNIDRWGIPVTYAGYALLFIGLIWMLFDPKGSYRRVLRSPLLKQGPLRSQAAKCCLLFILAATMSGSTIVAAPHTLPKETADRLGRLNVLYNDRICPLQTYALDFTRKLSGKRHYGEFTAEQVLAGFLFFSNEWNREPLLKVKGDELRNRLRLPARASVAQFFGGGYVLGPYVEQYYQGGQTDKLCREAAQMDDRLMLVMELQQGKPLKIFPHTDQTGHTTWYTPTEGAEQAGIAAEDRLFMGSIFPLLFEDIMAGRFAQVNAYLDKMLVYQQKNAGTSIPSDTRLQAERIYNRVPFATILFMVCLTMGFLTLAMFIYAMSRRNAQGRLPRQRRLTAVCMTVLLLCFIALTVCLALRWTVSGTIPMSNGYETMLLMAWLLQLITLVLSRRFPILITFGFLLSGFFLLVSHISQMDPQIGHLMPVLRSPLLTLHVSIIMMAFALLSLTFICGVTALIFSLVQRRDQLMVESLAVLSRVFLYPAITCLGFGIFIGAIWANISWGMYWSWDPKEVWALITLMVYAVVVHVQTFPAFRRPLSYHIFVTLSFLTILMTYFGVNYFLGGMHSYA